MYDELELDKLGDRKTALFLIMSDTDSTFNFLISMQKLSRWAFPSDSQRLHDWLQIRLRSSYGEKSAQLLDFPLSVTM